MSSLAENVTFDFSFPPCGPATPPTTAATYYDPNMLEIPFHPAPGGHHGHARSSSQCSAYSAYSFASTAPSETFLSTPSSKPLSTVASTPARSCSPIRQHGPMLLPKIRSQDQALGGSASSHHGRAASASASRVSKRTRTASPAPAPRSRSAATPNRRGRPPMAQAAATANAAHHVRSFTNPDPFMYGPSHSLRAFSEGPSRATPPPPSVFEATPPPPTLLCSPASFVQQQQQQQVQMHHDASPAGVAMHRRASSCSIDNTPNHNNMVKYEYGFSPYPGTLPSYVPVTDGGVGMPAGVSAASAAMAAITCDPSDDGYLYGSQQYIPREPSPLSVESISSHGSVSGTPEPMPMPAPVVSAPAAEIAAGPTSTLLTYLTGANPAPALVRTINFPMRDPNTKHYWWDVRQVRPWNAFSAEGLLSLPGAASVLTCPVPVSLLPPASSRGIASHPETEADLQATYASHYIPRINTALALSSPRPVQLTTGVSASSGESLFLAHGSTDSASAAALFGGKPTARVVGLAKSFDRFNTGMRAEGNIKRVEYLRGLAHLHHMMREHSCRYGFILTEIELVVVRTGTDATPFFGQLEVAAVPLDAKVAAAGGGHEAELDGCPLTACLALWGLCMLASDELAMAAGAPTTTVAPSEATADVLICSHATHIGAPAEGTRQKAAPRDGWMPPVQLAEKRMAKRARGWVMPEDAVGRKEMGRRGVKYGGM